MKLADALERLNLTIVCTSADARTAYKRRALELHPDRNDSPDAKEEFQKLGQAYARVRKFHDGGGQDGSGDDGSVPTREDEIEGMLRELFGERLSKGAAQAIASTIHAGAAPNQPPPPPPGHGRYHGPPTDASLAEKIAATRAKVTAAEKAAREAKAAAAAAPCPPPPPPPTAAEVPDEPVDGVLCAVMCDGVTLELTVAAQSLALPLGAVLVQPILRALHEQRPGDPPLGMSDVTAVLVDGRLAETRTRADAALTSRAHTVKLQVRPDALPAGCALRRQAHE